MRSVSSSALSLSFGAAACLLFVCLSNAARTEALIMGNVLHFLDSVGLVRSASSYISELRPASFFSLNDANALLWFRCAAFAAAFAGVGFSILAEKEGEPTLYSSAGFILSTIGIWFLYPLAASIAQIGSIFLLFAIRRRMLVK